MSSNEELDNDPYYVGMGDDGTVEVFQSSNPREATAEATGYEAVDGPYKSREKAEEIAESWRD